MYIEHLIEQTFVKSVKHTLCDALLVLVNILSSGDTLEGEEIEDETPLENALICLEKIKRILVTTDRELFATAEMEMKKQAVFVCLRENKRAIALEVIGRFQQKYTENKALCEQLKQHIDKETTLAPEPYSNLYHSVLPILKAGLQYITPTKLDVMAQEHLLGATLGETSGPSLRRHRPRAVKDKAQCSGSPMSTNDEEDEPPCKARAVESRTSDGSPLPTKLAHDASIPHTSLETSCVQALSFENVSLDSAPDNVSLDSAPDSVDEEGNEVSVKLSSQTSVSDTEETDAPHPPLTDVPHPQTTNASNLQETGALNPQERDAPHPLLTNVPHPLTTSASNPQETGASNPQETGALNPQEKDASNPEETDASNLQETDAPHPLLTNIPHPQTTSDSNPEETGASNPQETDASNPQETGASNPQETDAPNPEETDASTPQETDAANPQETGASNPQETDAPHSPPTNVPHPQTTSDSNLEETDAPHPPLIDVPYPQTPILPDPRVAMVPSLQPIPSTSNTGSEITKFNLRSSARIHRRSLRRKIMQHLNVTESDVKNLNAAETLKDLPKAETPKRIQEVKDLLREAEDTCIRSAWIPQQPGSSGSSSESSSTESSEESRESSNQSSPELPRSRKTLTPELPRSPKMPSPERPKSPKTVSPERPKSPKTASPERPRLPNMSLPERLRSPMMSSQERLRSSKKASPILLRSPNNTSPMVLRSPNKTSSMVLRSPNKTSSMVLRSPNKTSSMVLRSPNKTSSMVLRSPNKTSSMVLRSPNKISPMVLRSPKTPSPNKASPRNASPRNSSPRKASPRKSFPERLGTPQTNEDCSLSDEVKMKQKNGNTTEPSTCQDTVELSGDDSSGDESIISRLPTLPQLRRIRVEPLILRPPITGLKRKWSVDEEARFILAVTRHGVGNWTVIKNTGLFPGRSNVNLKDKYRTLHKQGRLK